MAEKMLTIDDREARAHPVIVQELSKHFHVEVARLDFGDYVFLGHEGIQQGIAPRIAIELSTPSDLVQKANSDRLAYQLGNMLDTYDVCYLLVTSPITERDGYVYLPGSPSACKWERLQSLLDAAQAHGVRVSYCANSGQIGARITSIVNYWLKDPSEHKYFRPRKGVPILSMPVGPAIDDRLLTLMSLPEVGEQRAIDALNTFGSLIGVFTARPKALQSIPGWGPKTAQMVHNYLTEFVAPH